MPLVTRVNGGIINDQMLAGSLLFFKITNATNFGMVISDGTVNLNSIVGSVNNKAAYFQVSNGVPVVGSAADIILSKLSMGCEIVQIGLVGTNVVTEIHLAVSGSAFRYISSTDDSSIDTAAMKATMDGTYTVPATVGSGDPTITPATASLVVNSTVTKVPFLLA